MDYPFEPRSNRHLVPGQFWSVPLSDGRLACGRVLDVRRDPDPFVPVNTRMFLAGLLDWVGAEEPSRPDLAGHPLVNQGFAHVRTIRETGGRILGHRPLEADGIEPYPWRTHVAGGTVWVSVGARRLRPSTPADAGLPLMSTWGYSVIKVIAEARFVEGREPPP